MVEILEFKDVHDLNNFLNTHTALARYEVIPVSKMFEHPKSKLIISCVSYVLIIRGI